MLCKSEGRVPKYSLSWGINALMTPRYGAELLRPGQLSMHATVGEHMNTHLNIRARVPQSSETTKLPNPTPQKSSNPSVEGVSATKKLQTLERHAVTRNATAVYHHSSDPETLTSPALHSEPASALLQTHAFFITKHWRCTSYKGPQVVG